MKPSKLSQPEKEALFDMLLAVTYGDDHLSYSENELVKSIFEVTGWDSNCSPDVRYGETIAAVRAAAEKEGGLAEYVSERARIFSSDESRALALQQVEGVISIDGVEKGEPALLEAARKVLG